MRKRDFIFLSTAEWDNPFWTNKQHVASELARLGHRVLYIDSLGLRRPSASSRDLKRILRRAFKGCLPPQRMRDGLRVWSPLVLPFHQFAFVQRVNGWLLRGTLAFWMTALRLRPDVLWTYNPLTAQILDLGKFTTTVYHCVDDIKEQPGMPVAVLAFAEQQLCERVDIIFATSPALAQSRRKWNANTHYLPNVADFQHFSRAREASVKVPADLAQIPGPILGFIGAISGYKVDLDLICQLAAARPGWAIVMIGSVGEGDPWTDSTRLGSLPNIHLLGARSYAELPAYLKGFDVALMPNMLNEYTRSMFPMKFFEYLAAGKPVVSVDLHALQEFAHIACIAKNLDGFIAGVESALAGGGAALETRLDVAERYTYKARTKKMLELMAPAPARDYSAVQQPSVAIPGRAG